MFNEYTSLLEKMSENGMDVKRAQEMAETLCTETEKEHSAKVFPEKTQEVTPPMEKDT